MNNESDVIKIQGFWKATLRRAALMTTSFISLTGLTARPRWTLRRYLTLSLMMVVSIFSIFGAIYENQSFIADSLAFKSQSERVIASLFHSAVREAMILGRRFEVRHRAKSLSEMHSDLCVAVEMSGQELQNCDHWKRQHEPFSSQQTDIFNDRSHSNKAGQFSIYFDHRDLYSKARDRLILALIILFALGTCIFILVEFAIQRIFTEVRLLTGINPSQHAHRHSFAEFETISVQLTSKMRTEIELQRARSVSDFARQIAHEIRSPITALNMISSQFSGLSDRQRNFVQSVSTRLQEIANSILSRASKSDFSSLGAFPVEYVLLDQAVTEILNEKRREHSDCLIRLLASPAEPTRYIVEANDRELKRIISNLINNAVEAKAPHRECEISVAIRREKSDVVLAIHDNGSGFLPEVLERVGERGVTSKKFNGRVGYGLGLFNAKLLIEQWKGRLEISTVADAGSAVELWLPIKNEKAV